jgi:hypothetical protein
VFPEKQFNRAGRAEDGGQRAEPTAVGGWRLEVRGKAYGCWRLEAKATAVGGRRSPRLNTLEGNPVQLGRPRLNPLRGVSGETIQQGKEGMEQGK